MTDCPSRESRYVPWSSGEVFACLECGLKLRQDHQLKPLRGEGYEAVYPFPTHRSDVLPI